MGTADQINFVAIPTYTTGENQVVKHADVVQLQVLQKRDLNANAGKNSRLSDGRKKFGDVKKKQTNQKRKKPDLQDKVFHLFHFKAFKNVIKANYADRILNQGLCPGLNQSDLIPGKFH
jgi:hypothetical protein